MNQKKYSNRIKAINQVYSALTNEELSEEYKGAITQIIDGILALSESTLNSCCGPDEKGPATRNKWELLNFITAFLPLYIAYSQGHYMKKGSGHFYDDFDDGVYGGVYKKLSVFMRQLREKLAGLAYEYNKVFKNMQLPNGMPTTKDMDELLMSAILLPMGGNRVFYDGPWLF